jgi:streptogramin lyase
MDLRVDDFHAAEVITKSDYSVAKMPCFSRRSLFALLLFTLVSVGVVGEPRLLSAEPASGYPNPYRVVENALTLPTTRPLGWVFGIDVDRNGKDIWVFDTCAGDLQGCTTSTVDPIMRFDASGKLVKSFGGGMIAHPHGLYVDPSGNVWVCDGVGGTEKQITRGMQVFKFSPDGTLLMTLGTAGVKGRTETTFNMPTDVVVSPKGAVFVADGGTTPDTNARIVEFTKDGKFIKAFGTPGDGPGQLSEPHSIAMDSRGRLFVGDRRNNSRIQIFNQDGTFLEEWKQFGIPSEIFIDHHNVMYVSNSLEKDATKRGIYVSSAKDGRITAFIPNPDPSQELMVPDRDGNVWTAFTATRKILKHVKTKQ